jgi:DHA1 family bicyclomycin/chloramphenicol resistance-like MFS transporter
MLIVWRFLQGFAGAGGSVLSRSIARDKYQGTLLTQFFALLMTVNGIAPVFTGAGRLHHHRLRLANSLLDDGRDRRRTAVMSLTVLRETLPAKSGRDQQQR